MKTKAFTLVELVVVITILAILGTISFISLSGYSKEARDAKRITDISSLLSKINIEETRGTPISDLITTGSPVTLRILGNDNPDVQTFREANFKTLKEDEKNFRDPSNKSQNYPMAYAFGGSGRDAYKFIQIATISEKENKAVIKGNYYTLDSPDAPSLFLTGGITQEDGKVLENGGGGLPYPPTSGGNTSDGGQNFSCTGTLPENSESSNTDSLIANTPYQNTDENGKCYYKCKENYITIGEGEFCNVWVDPDTNYKWQANPTGAAQWATNDLYTEPEWDETTKKYMYPEGRKDEDYPAFKACTDLGAGWRLPTKIELDGLIDKKVTTAAKTNHPGILPNRYWSSTLVDYDYSSNYAWGMNFANATTYYNYTRTTSYYIVCIHD